METHLSLTTNRRRFLSHLGATLGTVALACETQTERERAKSGPKIPTPQITNQDTESQVLEHIAQIDDGRAHRSDASILTHEGLIHLLGGSRDHRWTRPTDRYTTFNPDTLEWTHQRKMPQQLSQMTALGIEGSILTVGGKQDDQREFESGALVNQVLLHDTEHNTWNALSNFPTPIASAHAVIANGVPHILGGYTSFTRTQGKWHGTTYEDNPNIYTYDITTDRWTIPTQLPTHLSFMTMTAAAHNGKIYVFGSANREESEAHEDVTQIYDPTTHTWETDPLPSNFFEAHAFTHENNLFLLTFGESRDIESERRCCSQRHSLYTYVEDEPWRRIDLHRIPFNALAYTEKIVHNEQLYFFGPPHPGQGYNGQVYKRDLQDKIIS